MKTITGIKLFGATIGGGLSYFLGGWDIMLETLVTFTVLDILTGMAVGIINKELSSETAWFGFLKKIGIFIIVGVAVKLDLIFQTDVLRGVVTGFYISTEGLSIAENWGNIGLPMPEKLKEVLAQVKDKKVE